MWVLKGNDFAHSQGRCSYWTKYFPTYHFLQIIGNQSYLLRLWIGTRPILFTQSLREEEQTVEAECLSCLEIVETRWDVVGRYYCPQMDNTGREESMGVHILEQHVIVLSALGTKSILPTIIGAVGTLRDTDRGKPCPYVPLSTCRCPLATKFRSCFDYNHGFFSLSQMLFETGAQAQRVCKDQPAVLLLRLFGQGWYREQRGPFPGRDGKPFGKIWLFAWLQRGILLMARPLWRDPIALPLEGIGGQRNTPSLLICIKLGPIDGYSSTPELPTGIEQKGTI
jgi:hypothetical protein